MTRIIVVGGGAGGLELATKLGRTLGRKNRAQITLVDRKASHLWKPLLHEVATGSLDEGVDALSYRAHAKNLRNRQNDRVVLRCRGILSTSSKVVKLGQDVPTRA